MKAKKTVVAGLAGLACVGLASSAAAGGGSDGRGSSGLVREVRIGTADFRDVSAAEVAGYGSAGSCVSGPDEGAMGIHYPNEALIGDGVLDPRLPEALIYEERNGRLRLVGAEFLVIYDAWHANNEGPPVLLGQHFNYAGSPNRYGLPPYYQLHVWAWRSNPKGMFANWNPRVSWEGYDGE
jgi:hypothetical protein